MARKDNTKRPTCNITFIDGRGKRFKCGMPLLPNGKCPEHG